MESARELIQKSVLMWQDVTVHPHRFGGIEFRLGKRELGHLHGNSLLDVPFPRTVRNELVASGQAEEHHILPGTGWISFRIRAAEDVERAVDLLRRSFELARESRARKAATLRYTSLEEH